MRMSSISRHAITLIVLTTLVPGYRLQLQIFEMDPVFVTAIAMRSGFEYKVDLEMASNNWSNVYADYCGYKCHNGFKIPTQSGDYCTDPECYECECGHHCMSKGTCCPSLYYNEIKHKPNTSNIFEESMTSDLYNRATCEIIPASLPLGKEVLVVTKCLNSWEDENVRQKCEHPSFDSMESITFLSDVKTGLAFRNIYCVQCNGLEVNSNISHHSSYSRDDNLTETNTIRPIHYMVTCDSYDGIYDVTDPFKFLKFAWFAKKGLCSLSADIDDNGIPCKRNETSRFDSCPVDSPEILRDLCDNLPPVKVFRVAGAKNLFCSLCNEPATVWGKCAPSSDPYFELLFGTSETVEDNREICGAAQTTKNEKAECLPVSCPEGKVTKDDHVTCQTALDNIRGLSYQFIMTLSPELPISKDARETFASSIHRSLSRSVPFTEFNYNNTQYICEFDESFPLQQEIIELNGYIRASKNLSRDEVENEIIKAFLPPTPWRVPMTNPDGSTYNNPLRIVCLGREICDVYRSQSNQQSCAVFKKVFQTGFENIEAEMNYLEISSKLTCPYVSIQPASGPFVFNKNIQLSLEINNKTINVVWNPSSMSYRNGTVHICLHFYKLLVEELKKSRQSANEIILVIQYYLDIVCILVSCVLLSAAIVTYLLFPSLRTVPGLNTLCLCVCVLTAQVSLLMTTDFRSPRIFTEVHCVVHGVIVHYSWVASFTWMNTCCIHMYRVFTGNIAGSKQKQFTWNCVYSFGFPLLVVITTIIVTAVSTQGDSIGYDKTTCFLDTNTSMLIIVMGLLVPLLLTVVTNTVLFMVTMREIIAIRRLKKDNKNHQGVVTYVKLSAVTGLSCLVTATAIQFNNPILSLIASPLAGLQGVFIFFSFTANRRVLKLYRYFILRRNTVHKMATRHIAHDFIKEMQ